jgi:hypothetical protein
MRFSLPNLLELVRVVFGVRDSSKDVIIIIFLTSSLVNDCRLSYSVYQCDLDVFVLPVVELEHF